MVPSVNVVVTNMAGDILLIRRSDNQNWAVPGGAIALGESMVQAAVRETMEETVIDCEITGLVGIYTDPKHLILYTSNGEVRQEFSIVLTARATGGAPTRSSESSDVRWVPRESLGGYAMDRSMRLRLGHFLEGRVGAVPGLRAASIGCWLLWRGLGLSSARQDVATCLRLWRLAGRSGHPCHRVCYAGRNQFQAVEECRDLLDGVVVQRARLVFADQSASGLFTSGSHREHEVAVGRYFVGRR